MLIEDLIEQREAKIRQQKREYYYRNVDKYKQYNRIKKYQNKEADKPVLSYKHGRPRKNILCINYLLKISKDIFD